MKTRVISALKIEDGCQSEHSLIKEDCTQVEREYNILDVCSFVSRFASRTGDNNYIIINNGDNDDDYADNG